MTKAMPAVLRDALAPAFEPTVDLPLLFFLVQDKLPAVLGFQAGRLWIVDPARGRLLGPRDVGVDPADGFPDDLGREGLALEAPLWVAERNGTSPLQALFSPDVRSWMVAPVRLDGESLGVAALLSRGPVAPPDDPGAAGKELAALLAPPIRRALSQAAVIQDLNLHQLLLDLVRRMSGSFALPDLLQHLFRSLERLLPVDAMFVAVKGPDGRYEALLETDLDEQDRRMFFPTPRPIDPTRSKVLEAVDPQDYLLILRTPEELRQLQSAEPGAAGIGNVRRRSASLLYVPIWSGEAFAGILSVQSYRPEAYRHSDARRLLQLADYIGLALRLSREPGILGP